MIYNQYINPKKIESKNIYRHGNFVGLAMLLTLGIEFFASTVLIAVIAIFRGGDISAIKSMLTDEVIPAYALNTIICAVCVTFPFILSAKLLKHKYSSDKCFGWSPYKGITKWCVALALGFCAVGNVVTSIVSSIVYSVFNVELSAPTIGDGTYTAPEFLFMFLSSAVVPAFLEEFAFRATVFGVLKKFGDWPAIIVSSLLFAMMHANFVQIPFALFVGIGFGLSMAISKSIWPGVIAHFLNNAFAALGELLPSSYQSLASFAIVALFAVLGIIGHIRLSGLGGYKQIEDVPSCMPASERTGKLIISPLNILGIAVFMLLSVVNVFVS